MKRSQQPLPATQDALRALGSQIAAGRRHAGWTAEQLGERIGASAALVSRIEKGNPGVSIGTMLDAAVVCGVRLFDSDPRELGSAAMLAQAQLALLPARVRPSAPAVSDDF